VARKKIQNLGHLVLGVLAKALRQLVSTQLIPFKPALRYIRVLVNFNMMGQYRSHTVETITYMEDYLDTFPKMKDIILEFGVSKRMRTKINEEQRQLRHYRPKTRERIAPSKRCQIRDPGREDETEQPMDLLFCKLHFIFIKLHLVSHFGKHIRQFGNIPIY